MACAPGSGTLPPFAALAALVVRRVSGKAARRPWSAEIHLRFQIAHGFYTQLCLALETGGAARRVTTFNCKHRQAARRVVSTAPSACGWLRGTSRTSPGPPRRWRRPVRLQGTSARGRGFAAYLSAWGGQPFIARVAGYARGASLTTFGFVTTVPRYLLVQVIPSHSFAALTALVVRRVSGIAALFVRRVSGYTDRPDALRVQGHWRVHPVAAPCRPRKWFCRPTDALPVLVARTPPEGALACAFGSGTLPPYPAAALCRRFALSSDVRSEGAGLPSCRGVVKAGARSPRPCDGEGAGIFPQKSGKMRKADAVRRVPGFLALLALLPFKSLPQSQAGCFSAMSKNTLRSHRHVAGLGGGGRSAPAGVSGQSPGPPEV